MATIGSGTKPLVNLVSTATWRAVDLDQCFAAFAEQLGGVAWGSGIPLIYGGNLDSTNFATGMALDSRFLAHNKHWRTMMFAVDRNPYSTTLAPTKTKVSFGMTISRACFSVAGWSAVATMSGSVLVKVDGTTVATITAPTLETIVTRVGQPIVRCVSMNVPVISGSEVEVDFSGLTCAGFSFYDRQVVLMGYGDNIA